MLTVKFFPILIFIDPGSHPTSSKFSMLVEIFYCGFPIFKSNFRGQNLAKTDAFRDLKENKVEWGQWSKVEIGYFLVG